MSELVVKIPLDAIEQCVVKVLSRDANMVRTNPLAGIIATEIKATAESLRPRIAAIVAKAVAGDELERRVMAAFRAAVVDEAEKIGRKAARAIAMGKEPTP